MTKAERRDANWAALWKDGYNEGMYALEAATPAPMTVVNSMTGQRWHESEGACGFAWVVIRPGGSSFARWLKKHDHASNHYHGGVSVWVRAGGQSVDRKTAFATAMARVFQEAGIRAVAGSRLD